MLFDEPSNTASAARPPARPPVQEKVQALARAPSRQLGENLHLVLQDPILAPILVKLHHYRLVDARKHTAKHLGWPACR